MSRDMHPTHAATQTSRCWTELDFSHAGGKLSRERIGELLATAEYLIQRDKSGGNCCVGYNVDKDLDALFKDADFTMADASQKCRLVKIASRVIAWKALSTI